MTDRLMGRKVNVTRDYRLFSRSMDNRIVKLKKHKALERSMKRYGFLSCYPVICYRDENKKLIVKDGQHRLAFAESLGLPVYWIEQDIDFDVAVVNSTPKVWAVRDFAEKHAANGLSDYQEALEFADSHKLSVGNAFALLSGTTNYTNIEEPFKAGLFKIKDREWASSVASIYAPISNMSGDCRNSRFLEACMAVCRVAEFDAERLLHNCARCRDKLVSYSTRDAYLDMLEEVYNFGRKQLVGLRAAATMAMRDRSATVAAKKKKAAKNDKTEEVAA